MPTMRDGTYDPKPPCFSKYWVPSFAGHPLAMKAFNWMNLNPEAMGYFEKFALHAAGREKKFGISLLTERIRWEVYIETRGNEDYKICNTHRAYIARYLLYRYPQLEGYLRIKKLASESLAVFEKMQPESV